MTLRYIIFFLISLLNIIPTSSSAQEGNIWYFGEYAGLNFNTSPPTVLTNGAINTLEGCATISNKRGQLLFYTDGLTVYNKNHLVMPNGTGLLGNSSSTQSAIVIPNPGDSNLYYIFTADCVENNFTNGYNYSVVDMRLNNGLGDIVTSQKNRLLYKPCSERLTAVKAANGIDYWVLTKGIDNNRFTVYKVDCNGINLNPVISDVGTAHTNPLQLGGAGALKASPDGKKVCVAMRFPTSMAELFDFDNSTGILSNPIKLDGYANVAGNVYGVEFSPNSKLVYVGATGDKTITQYDITSNNAAIINASKFVMSTEPYYPAGLQVAPDKKIYACTAFPLNDYISAINNPDVYGPGCNLTLASFYIGRFSGNDFPAYIASFFTVTNNVDFTHSFVNCHVKFDGTTTLLGNLSWDWDFGDGTFASGQTVNHSFKKIGNYNVTLKVRSTSSACSLQVTDSFSVTKTTTINNVFAVDYGYSGFCVNEPTQFSDSTVLTIGNITARTWDFGDGSPFSNALNPVHTYTTPGMYKVKLLISTSGVCNADSIIKDVYIDTKPTLVFSAPDGCINQPVLFTDNSVNTVGNVALWKWYFGDGDSSMLKNPVHSYLNYGNYSLQLTATSVNGCAASPQNKPVVIDSKPVAAFDFLYPCTDKPTVFTNNSSNVFGSMAYNWSFGDNSSSVQQNPVHQYNNNGNYTAVLTASTPNGCSTSISKTIVVLPHFANAGRDTIALYDQPHQLTGTGTGNFMWTPATNLSNAAIAMPVAKLRNDQLFTLQTVNADGCTATDDVLIKVVTNFNIYVPSAFTPNGDGLNDILKAVCYGIDRLNYFRIFNRYGQEIYSTKEMNKGWDGTIKGTKQPQGAYVWMVQGVDIFGKLVTHKGSTILLP